ncbi:MAG: cytochrome P450 [Acidimicrobiales bacterium]
MLEPADLTPSAIAKKLTLPVLEHNPYSALAELRAETPVAWVPALGGWLVTSHEQAVAVMRDADTFTVDDPRFSTAQVLGPSMLSTEGQEHRRRRRAFAESFRPSDIRNGFEVWLRDEAERRVVELSCQDSSVELRTALAGPVAAATISRFLGLVDGEPETILTWYERIVAAIVAVTVGEDISSQSAIAIAKLKSKVIETTRHPALSLVSKVHQSGQLSPSELESEVAVLMFGAIETSEGMIANALWQLLTNPQLFPLVRDDEALLAPLVEESLRLEPAATRIDRYCTRDAKVGDANVRTGDLVIVSLLAANRDPQVFDTPDEFDIDRSNTDQHLAFVQGPHACLGLHLARLETIETLRAVVAAFPGIALDRAASEPPQGLIFRKPPAVVARLGN